MIDIDEISFEREGVVKYQFEQIKKKKKENRINCNRFGLDLDLLKNLVWFKNLQTNVWSGCTPFNRRCRYVETTQTPSKHQLRRSHFGLYVPQLSVVSLATKPMYLLTFLLLKFLKLAHLCLCVLDFSKTHPSH